MSARPERFSDTIHAIRVSAAKPGILTMGDLIAIVGPKGHVFLIVFLILPFLQPIPLPGLSTAVGLTIAFIGSFLVRDRPPWLPARLARAKIEGPVLLKLCSALERIMRRLEKILKPRGRGLFQIPWFRQTHGLMLMLHALLMSLPLPIPLSNFLPAAVVFLVALGFLEEDFFVIVASYAAALLNASFFIALVVFPYFGIKWLQ